MPRLLVLHPLPHLQAGTVEEMNELAKRFVSEEVRERELHCPVHHFSINNHLF